MIDIPQNGQPDNGQTESNRASDDNRGSDDNRASSDSRTSNSPLTTRVEFTGTAEPDSDQHRVSVFTAVGGQVFFDRLVERFYALVAADEVLLPLYPDQVNLGPARERLALFLAQYWGGPGTYSEMRGHPRLRGRHVPFAIGQAERDHWMAAMTVALAETVPECPLDAELQAVITQRMTEHFNTAADHMVNQTG